MMRSPLSLAALLRSVVLVVGYARRYGAAAAAARIAARAQTAWRRLTGRTPAGAWSPPPGPADARFAAWLADNAFTQEQAAALRAALDQMDDQMDGWMDGPPLFSVVMPVYNTPVDLLDQAVASVRAQVYAHWELCVVDDASTDSRTHAALRRWAALDPRIKVDFQPRNGGISRATNAAAALATGEFLAFLDHDDVLAPDALGEMALAVAAAPDADFLYSDDDKIDMEGRRYAPQFKPGWSPVWLLSYMYIGHLKVVRRSLFAELGGFRVGFEGSQDYDFALRAAERARRVVHAPKILYHWRAAPGSTATSGDAKPAAFEAGRRAVAEALVRRGVKAEAFQPAWAVADRLGAFGLRFAEDGAAPSVAIILRGDQRAADRLAAATAYGAFSIVAIPAAGREDKDIPAAVRAAAADFLLFVDGGLRPADPGWLTQMVGYARLPGVGAVGARLLDRRGRVAHAGLSWGPGWAGGICAGAFAEDYGYLLQGVTARECAGVSRACLLTPRTLYLETYGEDAPPWGGEDPVAAGLEYGRRLAAVGRSCVYCPSAVLQEARTGRRTPVRSGAPVLEWAGQDPWRNPNLADDGPALRVRPYHHPVGGPLGAAPVRALIVHPAATGESAAEAGFLAVLRRLAGLGVLDPGSIWRLGGQDGLSARRMAGFQVVCAVGLAAFPAVAAAAEAGVPCVWFIGAAGPRRGRTAADACFPLPYRVVFDAAATAAAWGALNSRFNFAVAAGDGAAAICGEILRQARFSRGPAFSPMVAIPQPGD